MKRSVALLFLLAACDVKIHKGTDEHKQVHLYCESASGMVLFDATGEYSYFVGNYGAVWIEIEKQWTRFPSGTACIYKEDK